MSYELWGTDGANLVGSYGTEREALDVVADLAARYRSRAGKRLAWLALRGPDGGFLAEGAELVARATGTSTVSASPRRRRAA